MRHKTVNTLLRPETGVDNTKKNGRKDSKDEDLEQGTPPE